MPFLHNVKPGHAYHFFYTNHKGEYGERHVMFRELSWGSTDYYPELQFLFTGFDVDKREIRSFSFKSIDIRTFALFTDHELKRHLNPPADDAPVEEAKI